MVTDNAYDEINPCFRKFRENARRWRRFTTRLERNATEWINIARRVYTQSRGKRNVDDFVHIAKHGI